QSIMLITIAIVPGLVCKKTVALDSLFYINIHKNHGTIWILQKISNRKIANKKYKSHRWFLIQLVIKFQYKYVLTKLRKIYKTKIEKNFLFHKSLSFLKLSSMVVFF